MSKKSDLIQIVKEEAYHLKGLANAINMQSEYYFDYHVTAIENLHTKFEDIASEKLKDLENIMEANAAPHGCTDTSFEQYIENSDSGNIARCAGVYEMASIDAIEQLF